MTGERGVVIVGGGLAAVRAAELLRRADESVPVTIVSDEAHLPYDRPPLSKAVLRAETDDVSLKTAEFYADNAITVRLGSGAASLNSVDQTVTLLDGDVIAYDQLVIATGLRPKRIPSFPDIAGVRVLRTLDESLALREHAGSARRAVVIGAGFIGCEVAASLRLLGVEVSLIEPQPAPLASVLGEQIGNLVARLHSEEGVDVRCGVGVDEIKGTTHVESVVLSDGVQIEADLVVVGIGSTPSVEWLRDSGVDVDDGVVCDSAGRTNTPNVWALGDVASWRNEHGHQARVEHWSNVAEQARALVPALLGAGYSSASAVVPYFWSDQYDVKVQCLGEPDARDDVHVVADDGRRFLAYYERNGVIVGVVGGGMSGRVMKARGKIAAGAPIADVLG
ncbi:NAD(P)/FAD-dependent oxidoreductase [Mycobacterium yunnanensis]|uniref:NAD(P)/FAD-dependent oxidoreductase n=1 Tax=Mycobacterium yunnanensis TaxID=368477 RepID=A0A9X2Z4Y5_9MYCO|nr:FAD/NAD(P)-binding oxidoreductase [Mycobacterium yunnanensis]MCV7423104.1 NAD(P)/FAD-dependent oxidoreductase [Mycobacterium yunnanensis]